MESNNKPEPVFNFRYTIARKDIQEFVNNLHELQESYLNAAVEKSGYREANEVIKRIMEKK
jgi:hypothetical protein